MGFAINKKVADKKAASTTKTSPQAGGSSKFIAKANTKSSGGANKKPIKTGGSRGSWLKKPIVETTGVYDCLL